MYENNKEWVIFVKHLLKNIIEQCHENVVVTFWDMEHTAIHPKPKYAYHNYAKYKVVNYEYICSENVEPSHYIGTYGVDKPYEFNDDNLDDITGLSGYIKKRFEHPSHIFIHLTCRNYLDSIRKNGLYGENNQKKPVTFHQERSRMRSRFSSKSRKSRTRSRSRTLRRNSRSQKLSRSR